MDEHSIRRSLLGTSLEEKRLYRARIQKFRKCHTLYVVLLASLATLQFIAISFFTRGFLLTRQVLDDVAVPLPQHYGKFNKAVVLVIDALRFDFAIPVEESHPEYNANYHNNLKALWDDGHHNGSSLLLKFIADPPTTTLQRLKGLTTGSLPTFIDAGSNFDGSVIEEDNLIKQLYLAHKNVYFAGDDTWDALFSPFLSPQSKPYPSLNVWDLDTVDNGVISFFNEHLLQGTQNHRRDWDVLVGHMLGVDHVGHKYGPNHFTMREKQLQVDDFIRKIIAAIDEDTMLVVLGDHGMDHTGNHGGDSVDELESTLFLYSKRPGAWQYSDNTSVYDTSDLGRYHRKVNQIDLVPTLALLLDLPIPFNNLGWPVKEIASSKEERDSYTRMTLQQLSTYKNTSGMVTSPEKKIELDHLWKIAMEDPSLGPLFQQNFLETCKDLWARFDFWSIGVGIVLMTISLVLLLAITKLIPSIVVSQMVFEFVPWIVVMSIISNACFHGVFFVFQQPSFVENTLWCSLLATAVGIIFGTCIPIFDRYNIKWIAIRFFEDSSEYWTRIGVMLLTIHSLLFTSNSFTIWEDRIVAFLLISLGMLTLYEFVFVPKRQSTSALLTATISEKQGTASGASQSKANSDSFPLTRFARLLGAYHSIVLVVCTRIASIITICREEQGGYCTPTFTTETNYSLWAMGLCLVTVAMIPSCIKGYYNLSSSYQAAAPIWIDIFLKSFLFTNFTYWTLTALENSVPGWSWNLSIFKFTISRIVAGFALIASNVGWMMGPLCVKLNVRNTDTKSHQATILGYSNIYGAQYFLLVVNALMSILLFNKPLAQVSLYLMCNQMLSIIEIFHLLKLKENIIGPFALALLAYSQFFSTGHQATIPSIQWDVGFILSEKITFPVTHLAIVLNTFGPHILTGLAVALLTLWEQPPDVLKPQTILGRLVSNCGMLLVYHTVLCLSSFLWVTFFRRHLMVWKIFCPRYLFAAMSLIVVQLVITFGAVAFASGRLIRQINDIFWK
ncbi:GPI13 (YLL031C) [Zygosaccharomyces parabailii]|nr:GPI13 (YLL031C) [Zygosaccharomyces parabailii]